MKRLAMFQSRCYSQKVANAWPGGLEASESSKEGIQDKRAAIASRLGSVEKE